MTLNTNKPISIYVHWPFCLSKCPYCDFNSHIFAEIDDNAWQKAYLSELDYFSSYIQNKQIKSIFFGGGTPSLMSPKIVAAIIDKIASLGQVLDLTEITIEANPTSSESSKFAGFKAAGINRLSIGVQSFNADDLKFLGRKHSADEAIKAIDLAAKHFENYSFDLIYARPGQSLEQWQKELELAISLASKHISLYQLTIEKGTPFYSMYHKGAFALPGHEQAFAMYELTNNLLEKNGYLRYEISNYAKPGFESMHNLNYWQYGQYLGIGPGAHSRLISSNKTMQAVELIYGPQNWLESVNNNNHGIRSLTCLTKQEVAKEILMMGLRLVSGIDNNKLIEFTDKDFEQLVGIDLLKLLQKENLLEYDSLGQKLTSNGLALHSSIIGSIFAKL